MIVGQDRVTDEVERLLLVVIKTFYARDTQVRGLADLPVAQLRVLNVLGRSAEERTPTMGELADALGSRAEHRDADRGADREARPGAPRPFGPR